MKFYILKKEVINEEQDDIYNVDMGYFLTLERAIDKLAEIYKNNENGGFYYKNTKELISEEFIMCTHCGCRSNFKRKIRYFVTEVEATDD